MVILPGIRVIVRQFLSDSSKRILCPRATPMCTVSGELGSGTVLPSVYSHLPDKTEVSYSRMFGKIKEKVGDLNIYRTNVVLGQM